MEKTESHTHTNIIRHSLYWAIPECSGACEPGDERILLQRKVTPSRKKQLRLWAQGAEAQSHVALPVPHPSEAAAGLGSSWNTPPHTAKV